MLAAVKTVYLHVGNFKTGTSAIQKYCSDHREELLLAGVDYLASARPAGHSTNHGCLPLSLYRKLGVFTPAWYDNPETFDEVAAVVRAEIASSSAPTVLISSEEFYRLASFREEVRRSAMGELKELFAGYEVQVVMYVREPLDFLKSWYNQVNKSALPTGRFTDFFYRLHNAFLMPHLNAMLWRECFSENCLIVQSYRAEGAAHVRQFLQLVGAGDVEIQPTAEKLVNPGRRESTLERDRLAKIMALPSESQRQRYLHNQALASEAARQKLEARIRRVNNLFEKFCRHEGLNDLQSNLSLEALLAHEEQVNPRSVDAAPGLRGAGYALLNHPFTRGAKRILKKMLPR